MSDPTVDAARPCVTVVVVTWQGRELTRACLTSLRGQSVPHEVLVVDNGSTDGTVQLLESDFPEARVLALPTNLGFAGGVAAALEVLDTPFLALLNNDARADERWLEASLRAFGPAEERVAAVTARMLLEQEPDTVNNAGVVLLPDGYGADRGLGAPDGEQFHRPAEVFGFSGGAAVLRTLAVRAVGGVDASYFMYYEDTDLAWRLRLAGWHVRYEPGAVVRHRHAASSDPSSQLFAFHNERNRLLMLAANAPAGFAAACLGRFVLTTASLTARRALGAARHVPAPAEPVFSPALRARVLVSLARRVGPVLARRARTSPRLRRQVLHDWRGVQARDVEPATEGGH